MARKAKPMILTIEEEERLSKLVRSKKTEVRLAQRAEIIIRCAKGEMLCRIAQEMGVAEITVIKWRDRYKENRIKGIYDKQRSGKPVTYGAEFRKKVLDLISTQPPKGQASWDGNTVAKELKVSADAVWRLLRKEGICLSRQRTWCVSTDPEFAQKAADVIGLYLDPPCNAIVISVDEKPNIQAIERTKGYVYTSSKKIVQGLKSTYQRHGQLNLFAALNIATGSVYAETTKQKRRVDFLSFMNNLLAELPGQDKKEIHVILDNYCTHKKNEAWLSEHPNVFFHYTPTSASWLNQIEIWFGILSRKALKNASFSSVEALKAAIHDFVESYHKNAKPFIWRKREVRGAQLKNTIANLCN